MSFNYVDGSIFYTSRGVISAQNNYCCNPSSRQSILTRAQLKLEKVLSQQMHVASIWNSGYKSCMLKACFRTHMDLAEPHLLKLIKYACVLCPLRNQKDSASTVRKQLETKLETTCCSSLGGVCCLYAIVLIGPV